MRAKFSTDDLEAAARFEAFRDDHVRRLFGMDMVCRTDQPFHATVDMTVTNGGVFGRILGSAADVFRDGAMVSRADEGAWVLLNRGGRLRVRQGDIDAVVAPGEGIVFDEVRDHGFFCMGDTDTWNIKIPDTQLRTMRDRGAVNGTVLLHAGNQLGGLIGSVLEAFHRLPEASGTDVEFLTATYLSDLVALALGASRDGAHLANERGMIAARRQAVLDAIAEDFACPAISADTVAVRLCIASRYVHLVLEETGMSFSEHVLCHRLDHARRLLCSPRRARARIAEIAYEAGFSDLSYFNRTFRRRFGASPSDLRRGLDG